jgi:hypothetical protein
MYRWTATYTKDGETHSWTHDCELLDDAIAAFDADPNTPNDVPVRIEGEDI